MAQTILPHLAAMPVQAQAFNLFSHADYYMQNGDGINQLQYKPIGANCGDGATLNQTCYQVSNSRPDNFGEAPVTTRILFANF